MGEEVAVVRTTEYINGGWDVVSSSATDADSAPDHLVVMVHGILGSSGDWQYAANEFVKQLPDKVVVHCSERNRHRLSLHGVDVMGERLAEEVLEVIGERPEIQKISFIAHSIGGLVARYAIARLYRPRTGNICGLEPINFIAVATPHLGSRGNKQVPLLLGFVRMENLASRVIHWLFGRAGRHLFLTDSEEGKPPLLLRMISDSGNLHFISALRAFKRRVAYANVDCDQVVGWRTSSIRRKNELPQLDSHINKKYPHIVHEEYTEAKDSGPCEDLTSADDFETMEEKMVNGLSRVSWEKVHVSFHNSLQWLVAHSIIQVKFSFMYEGADIIQHLIDHFQT
ncbi:putative lipase ROG1 [Carex rostrata]